MKISLDEGPALEPMGGDPASGTLAASDTASQVISKVSDEQQPKRPWRPILGLLVGGAGWWWAFQAINTVLLASRIDEINPEGKVTMVAWVSTVTMILSIVAGVVGGSLSDRTRSRIGARSPWIIGGVILGAICLLVFTFTSNLAVMLVSWWLYGMIYNAMNAAGCAWQPDMVAPRWRGTASSFFGIGQNVCIQGAQIVASMFVTDVPKGIMVSLAIFAVLSLASVALTGEPSNLREPRRQMSVREKLAAFMPPAHAGRDYWLAALARFMWMVPGGIGTYRLYTLTDYMGESKAAAGEWMALMAGLSLPISVAMCLISGPLADKFRTVKLPLFIAIFFVGLPCWLPFFIPNPVWYTVYVVFSAIGGGVFVALDQTIMTAVLPNPQSAAKDLAFLNSCGVLGNLFAPLLGAWVVNTFGYAGLFPMGFIVLTCAAVSVLFIKKIR